MAKQRSSKRTRRAEVKAKRARELPEGLPALESLSELPAFDQLRPSDKQREAFETYCAQAQARGGVVDELSLGCVVRLDRGYPAVLTRDALFRAEFAARLTKGDFSRIAVGDWVCVRAPHGHEKGVVEKILPRESDIARWRGGSRGERQTLAANVDVVLVVQALEEWRLSAGRVARSAVVARDCGAQVSVVLTKADAADSAVVGKAVCLVRDVLGSSCPVAVVSAREGEHEDALRRATQDAGGLWGVESVRGLVPPGTVAIMLGPSGVGKSTLLNALLGRAALETGAVRASDGAGRHTTVARRMVAIPGAGIIVDEPGLRTLQLVGHERGMQLVFPQVVEAASNCRFRNCTHTHEPGCEVRARFDAESSRIKTYLSLAREMRESATTLDPDVVL